ncbi:MAG: DPP IV N-terminal domain-containing protein [Gemmatimonas sp.]
MKTFAIRPTLVPVLVACAGALTASNGLLAQGTAADYRLADSLPVRVNGKVIDVADAPNWIGQTSRFWYRKSVKGGFSYVLVDAARKEKKPAFDHDKLARALNAAGKTNYSGVTLPIRTLTLSNGDATIDVVLDSARYRCTMADEKCVAQTANAGGGGRGFGGGGGGRLTIGGGLYGDRPRGLEGVRVSPDGQTEAYIRDFNVWLKPKGAKEGSPLSTDGQPGMAYQLETVSWSPDSKKLAAYRIVPGFPREVNYVISSPADQLQPKMMSRFYNKPGDALDQAFPELFDVATRRATVISKELFPNSYTVTVPVWRRDSRAFFFEYNQRGHQVFRVIEVDASSGSARAVINEETPTFFEYSAKKYRTETGDGREIIWASERDGWNHLYLYDGTTGKVKNQITKGAWVMRGVDRVDTIARQIWFRASGMNAKQDPYFIHYYRINFDGTGLVTYTEADGNHTVSYSPNGEYYVDSWSRVDLPPVSQLRKTADRSVVMDLEKADVSALLATGVKAPEPFVAKGRDGTTDIYGIIVRPSNFDAKKKYPVIEYIYAGPHDSFVPKTYGVQMGMQAQAELGFIVVQIDGMGTSNRSKAFHDVAWQNIADAGFPDRILWHKAVAARYASYDISRVGIYGGSAGGQNSLGALLFHPEFYKAAVSFAGCHDNRMDKIWWNEQWMGWPIGPQYAKSSNVDNAYRLQGKLLLVYGELDTNVDPSSTLQVVNALIKAGKYFDLLVMPNEDHPAGRRGDSAPYGDRKQWDFFVRNLIGREPLHRNVNPLAAPVRSTGSLPAAPSTFGPGWGDILARWGN